MPWVEFTDKFDFTPAADRRQTTAYKAGHRVLVTTECFDAAKAKGVAHKIKAPARGQEPTGEPVEVPVEVPAEAQDLALETPPAET